MSYTSFDYSSLSIRSTDLKKRNNDNGASTLANLDLYDDAYTVTFDVKNAGNRDGHEVSQLYLVSLLHVAYYAPHKLTCRIQGFPESAGEPPKVLRGFERTYIKSGTSQKVTIKLSKKAMSIWSAEPILVRSELGLTSLETVGTSCRSPGRCRRANSISMLERVPGTLS